MTGESSPQQSKSQSMSRRETTRLVTGIALGALVTAFCLINLDEVKVDWIFGTASTPLIVVIVVSLGFGAGIDRVIGARRRRVKKGG